MKNNFSRGVKAFVFISFTLLVSACLPSKTETSSKEAAPDCNNCEWVQGAFIKSSNHTNGVLFGEEVSISGDTFVVGGERKRCTAPNCKTTWEPSNIYVYKYVDEKITEEAAIAPDPSSYSQFFGYSVSIDGDLLVSGDPGDRHVSTTVLDSAPVHDNPDELFSTNLGTGSGAAYIYSRTENVWSQAAFLKPANSQASDDFGRAVAISGNNVIVGAPYEDGFFNDKRDSGAVYIFSNASGAWKQEHYLKGANLAVDSLFGRSLDMDGDTIVVGAPQESSAEGGVINGTTASTDTSARSAGAAYVFRYNETDNKWVQEAYLKAPKPDRGDYFGRNVSIFGDTIVVGALGEASNEPDIINGEGASDNNSAREAGAVYVFKRTGTTWKQEAYIKSPNPAAHDHFGNDVAISGDVLVASSAYEDSSQSIITNGGTVKDDNSTQNSGAAYVFTRNGSTWTNTAYLKTPNPKSNDLLHRVAISGNVIIAGALREDSYLQGETPLIQYGSSVKSEYVSGKRDSGAAYAFLYAPIVEDNTPPNTSVSVSSGGYKTEQLLTLSCEDGSGKGCADTYYLLNPSADLDLTTDPVTAISQHFTKYTAGDEITVGDTTLVVASVDKAGNYETLKTFKYALDFTAATSAADMASGFYNSTIYVNLSCDDGATGGGCDKIYYTTNGDEPSESSAVFSEAIRIAEDLTLKFFSVDLAKNVESVNSVEYKFDTTAPTTSASIAAGSYNADQSVALQCVDNDAGSACSKTYYTLDNSIQSQSDFTEYTQEVVVSTDSTLRYYSVDTAGNSEEIKTVAYTFDKVKPTVSASVASGLFASAFNVTLSCEDTGGSDCSKIFYTTDGSTPDSSSTEYSSAITISDTTPLMFMALDNAGNQSDVQSVTYTLLAAPTASVNVANTVNEISWSTVDSATSYNLYWSTTADAGVNGTKVTSVSSPYNHTGLTNGSTYYYVVTAVNGDLESGASAQVSGIPQILTPAEPTSVSAVFGDTEVTLNWTASANATSYKIYYSTTSGVTSSNGTLVSGATSGTPITGLSNSTTYYFVVIASNANGDSAASSEVSATPQFGAVAISANGFNFAALKVDGTVTTWSDNTYGSMGHAPGTNGDVLSDSGSDYYNITPASISGLSGVVAVASGYRHILALKDDNTVWAWGSNVYGELGHAANSNGDGTVEDWFLGTVNYNLTPLQVTGLSNVKAVAAGVNFSLALKTDGTVWAWGDNFSGQLGDNSTTASATPVQVVDAAGTGTLSNIVAIAASDSRAFAVDSSGNLWAWGGNTAGELGIGNSTDQSKPVQVNLSNVIDVKSGGAYSMALLSDGTVYSWGDNFDGQLGNGTTTASNTPVQVSGLTGIKEIASGTNTGFALKNDGTLWTWGSNSVGQLGDGTLSNRLTAVQVSIVSNVVEMFAGEHSAGVLTSDGTIQMWGNNGNGQLGHSPNTSGDLTTEFGDIYSATAVSLAISPAKTIAAPTSVSATDGGSTVVPVSWTASTGASSYNVYWSTTPGVNVLNGTKVTGVSSGGNITGLTAGTRYYFIVTSVDANGIESAPTVEVSAKP